MSKDALIQTKAKPDPYARLLAKAEEVFDRLIEPDSDLDPEQAKAAHKFLESMIELTAMQQAHEATTAPHDLDKRLNPPTTVNVQINTTASTPPGAARRQRAPGAAPPDPMVEVYDVPDDQIVEIQAPRAPVRIPLRAKRPPRVDSPE